MTLSAEGVFNIPIDPPLEAATLDNVWYELALDTDDDGLDVDDVFADRVAIRGIPYAHNADRLDGEDGGYYLNAANLTGIVTSARLNLTDGDIPDDITILLASEAESATQAASATNALLLEGQPGSYYLDAANLTGTVTSARLNLTDGDIPDDITILLASQALSATQAISATNALLLEGQPGSYYLDAANLTGTVTSARLNLTDNDIPDALTLLGSTMNNSPIGDATPSTGVFTALRSTGAADIESGTLTLGRVGLANLGKIIFHDSDGSDDFTTILQAGSDLVANLIFRLPSADGTSGQVLSTDGSGNLSFETLQVPIRGTDMVIGDNAVTNNNGISIGVSSNSTTSGLAVGYQANARDYGTAIGYRANGYDCNVSVGYSANAYTGVGPYSGSVTVGYRANSFCGDGAYSGAVAVGYSANARHNFNEDGAGAVAIGHYANAFISGVAIGACGYKESASPKFISTSGYNKGVAVGYSANGTNYGVAIGYKSRGYNYGTAIGYEANCGNNHYSFAKGYGSRCLRYNEEWKSSDGWDNQFGYGQVNFHGVTTTGTVTEIYLGGVSGQRFVLRDKSCVSFNILVSAVNYNTGDSSGWQLSGTIKRRSGAATTAIVGSVSTLKASEQGGLTVDPLINADTTNGALRLRVTGVNGNTVYWNAAMSYSEVREDEIQ